MLNLVDDFVQCILLLWYFGFIKIDKLQDFLVVTDYINSHFIVISIELISESDSLQAELLVGLPTTIETLLIIS